jgi:porin
MLPSCQSIFAALLFAVLTTGGPAGGADESSASQPAAAVPAPDAQAPTLFPVEDYTGSLCLRSRLTGDWGGLRTRLAERGFQTKLSFTQVYQAIADGGTDTSPAYGGWVDLELDFDFQKLGLWPGAFLMLRVDANYEDNINGHTGALMPANMNALMPVPGEHKLTLSHAVFTQFLSERFAVILGKLDTTGGDMNDFAHGRGEQQFLNLAFCFNPVAALAVPYSTLGAGIVLIPTDNSILTLSAIDADGMADESGFDTVYEGNTSYAGEFRVKTHFFDLPGHQLVGGVYSTKDFLSLNEVSDITIPRLGLRGGVFRGARNRLYDFGFDRWTLARPRPLLRTLLRVALRPELPMETDTWSIYYNFDQYVLADPKDPSQGMGFFGRFGAADADTNPFEYFYSAGFGGKGMIRGRPNDRYGIGYYFLDTSSELPSVLKYGDEQGVEAFYTVAVTPWCQITPDVQVIDPARESNDTTVVLGARLQLLF